MAIILFILEVPDPFRELFDVSVMSKSWLDFRLEDIK